MSEGEAQETEKLGGKKKRRGEERRGADNA